MDKYYEQKLEMEQAASTTTFKASIWTTALHLESNDKFSVARISGKLLKDPNYDILGVSEYI